MKFRRRQFLRLVASAGALPILPRSARALDYPVRPVHIIVGFPAGTSSDITARLIAQWLSEQLGQQFIVENRTGAGTNVAADSVVHASPDGYTLLWVTQTNAINTTLYETLNFNFIRDIEAVASILRVPAVMMVNPSVPANTVPEFIAYAKANPGKINAALNDSQFKNRFIDLGGAPTPMSTANFSNFIDAETEKWAKVVKFSGAKAE